MKDPVTKLKQQAEENGMQDVFTRKVESAVSEISAYFERESPELSVHFELCEDGVILTCDERCLGMTGTIRKDGELTLTFPAGKNLEQVVLSESAFQSRIPVLEGASKWANARLESTA